MPSDRDDGGQFTARVTDRDVLRALCAHDHPVATSTELADALGVSADTVRRHLATLHDDGRVERKAVGAHAVVWWIPRGARDDRAPPVIPAGDPFFDADAAPIATPVDETAIDDVVYGDRDA